MATGRCGEDRSGEGRGPCTNVVSKVVISIDDTGPLLRSPLEAVRARSLNRLDSFDEFCEAGADVYRCPSFPRLEERWSGSRGVLDSQTNCSMTHLETNSISPRVSTDNLTNVSDDEPADVIAYVNDGLGHAAAAAAASVAAGLIRSVSSKTVDELTPLDATVCRFDGLRPQQVDGTAHPVSRSTSCPSMACVRRSPSPRPDRLAPPGDDPERCQPSVPVDGGDENAGRPLEGKDKDADDHHDDSNAVPDDDVRTSGEQIRNRIAGRPTIDAACEEHPMHTKRLLEKQRDRLSLIRQNGQLYRNKQIAFDSSRSATERTTNDGNYVNIGDIPSAVAEKVMDKSSGNTRAVNTVQKKCLQWLNSLDNDDSS